MDGTPCTIQTENDNEGTNVVLRILDSAGNEVAVCYYSEGDTPPIDVVEKTTASILRAINMHDRLVAYLGDTLPLACTLLAAGGTCEGCDRGECADYRLLKEARGDK